MSDHDSHTWRYETGDTLTGEIVSLATYDAGYGDYPIVVIRDDSGEQHAWHAFHAVAVAQLAKLQPRVGERIAAEYLGKVAAKTEGGRPYHAWHVELPERPVEVDWAAMGKRVGVTVEEHPQEKPRRSSYDPATAEIPF